MYFLFFLYFVSYFITNDTENWIYRLMLIPEIGHHDEFETLKFRAAASPSSRRIKELWVVCYNRNILGNLSADIVQFEK